LENFIESLGFDPVLSEKGKIAYAPDIPLDASCYREVGTVDIFVLIVGGRYGSEASATKTDDTKSFYDRYNSITREEYRSAVERDIPVYILIERGVYAEYETYLRNKDNVGITYAHVDSVNIFQLIEGILVQPRNNPIQQFDRYGEIETWLREQWSGLFQELLQRMKSQAQLSGLQDQVTQLSELNKTLKVYLEEVVAHVAPKKSQTLIRTQTKRLENARVLQRVTSNPLVDFLARSYGIPVEVIVKAAAADSLAEFFADVIRQSGSETLKADVITLFSHTGKAVLNDFNSLRELLRLPPAERGSVAIVEQTLPAQANKKSKPRSKRTA
jgi:hypothetical protein